MKDFVNQKLINGQVYTAYRDSEDPTKQYIVREDGVQVECRLKEVWADNNKIVGLF